VEPSVALGRDGRMIIEAKKALRRAQVSVAPFRLVTTPRVSKSRGSALNEEQKESSHPRHSELEQSRRRASSPE